jgi:hypothetical protein
MGDANQAELGIHVDVAVVSNADSMPKQRNGSGDQLAPGDICRPAAASGAGGQSDDPFGVGGCGRRTLWWHSEVFRTKQTSQPGIIQAGLLLFRKWDEHCGVCLLVNTPDEGNDPEQH